MYLYKDDVMLSKQSNSESNEDSIKDDDISLNDSNETGTV